MNKTKSGLEAIGFVENRATCVAELNALTSNDAQVVTKQIVNQMVNNAVIEYVNSSGYTQSVDGTKVTIQDAEYIRFELPLFNKNKEKLFGWFCACKENKIFKGVHWGTLADFNKSVTYAHRFSIGRMYFNYFNDGQNFLDNIAASSVPETWCYKNHHSKIHQPILKSYLENILNKLVKEDTAGKPDRLVYSKNRKMVTFNSNLLDRFFHPILIAGWVDRFSNGDIAIQNPKMLGGISDLCKNGFDSNAKPVQPQFFEDVNEVIFQTSWKFDKDYNTFVHIIEQRIDRFPSALKNESPEILARKLDAAIEMAITMAERNYKIIAPMYRPQDDKIQLLMPIYLNGTYSEQPDFALIITPDKENKIYVPETILPLDPAYQNARLIAKPDESWLNPKVI